jgi:hypothetical protein
MDLARNLGDRLPRVAAGLRDGLITREQVGHIHRFTSCLDDEKAAQADKALAALAPDLSDGATLYRARKVCYGLDPELFDRMREEGARRHQRLDVGQEDSGNARVAMREMSIADAAAVKAAIDAEAVRLKNAGLDASLRQIRFWVARDRALGLDPRDRLAPGLAPPPGSRDAPPGDDPGEVPVDDGYRDDEPDYGDEDEGRPGGRAPGGKPPGERGPAPLPALISLVVTDKTLFGWSDQLGEAGGWGLVAPAQMRELVQAASLHPRTRWCVTLADPETGEAIGHGCARGRHPWTPPAALYDLLRALNVTVEPIAKGTCDHRHEERQYIPSRKLKHLVRARSATCPAPGCQAHALYNEIDHTREWPAGKTDECNLSGPCARHHHAKHAPGWTLRQIEPGVLKWTTPSGRSYITRPTRYDI